MDENKTFERVTPGDPMQCQMIEHSGNQCNRKRMVTSKYCSVCDQGTANRTANIKNIELFNIARYQDRVRQFRDNPRQKGLSDEIGILRMLLEEKINACQDSKDLLVRSQSISNLVVQIQLLVVAAAKLDTQLNNTLTRAQVDLFGQKVIGIISKYVEASALEFVADELQVAVDTL